MQISSHSASPASSNKACSCTGNCTGYATRSDCPPLIVLAVAAARESTGSQSFARTP